jgi:hypothetical protein
VQELISANFFRPTFLLMNPRISQDLPCLRTFECTVVCLDCCSPLSTWLAPLISQFKCHLFSGSSRTTSSTSLYPPLFSITIPCAFSFLLCYFVWKPVALALCHLSSMRARIVPALFNTIHFHLEECWDKMLHYIGRIVGDRIGETG